MNTTFPSASFKSWPGSRDYLVKWSELLARGAAAAARILGRTIVFVVTVRLTVSPRQGEEQGEIHEELVHPRFSPILRKSLTS